MPEHHIFVEIAIIFLFASILGLFLSKLKQPAIVAYIFAGVFLGPYGFGLLSNHEYVNEMSEIGVMALLFTLGLEFSLDKFKEIKHQIIFAGAFQLIGTILFVSVILYFGFSFNLSQTLFIASAIALSSTVVVLRTFISNAQIDSIHGKLVLGILIIQDISLIPIMIILPNLAAGEGLVISDLLIAIVKAGAFLGVALYVSYGLMPAIMNFVTSTNKEFLILSSVAIAIGTATLASYFGITLALGAFVAGLALSGTVHSKQVFAEVLPLRDVFAMVFFVSIGMLLDITFFINNITFVLIVVLAIVTLKFIVSFAAIYIAKYPGQTALWVGLSLFQIGEFSFIIVQLGYNNKIISEQIHSMFITVTLITMLITPFVIKLIPNIITIMQKNTIWKKYFKGPLEVGLDSCNLQDHVIIMGFGPIGRSVAKILSLSSTEFLVIELNNKTIQELRSENIQAIYGDATHDEILTHANICSAKILVITIPDIKTCEMATINARHLSPNVFIIVRTRFQSNIDKLYLAGANVVIYEEYETSMGVILNILKKLQYPQNKIETIINLLQSDNFQIIQNLCREEVVCRTTVKAIKDYHVHWVTVDEGFYFINKTIKDSSIRAKTGASIISIAKDELNIANPSPDTIIEKGDIIALLGDDKQINAFKQMIESN